MVEVLEDLALGNFGNVVHGLACIVSNSSILVGLPDVRMLPRWLQRHIFGSTPSSVFEVGLQRRLSGVMTRLRSTGTAVLTKHARTGGTMTSR